MIEIGDNLKGLIQGAVVLFFFVLVFLWRPWDREGN